MNTIEFFGPSGSGKTYLRNKLILKYFKEKKIYDYKSVNYNFSKNSGFVKIYFLLLKSKFIKKLKNILQIKKLKNSFLNSFYEKYKKNISTINYKKNEYNNLNKIKKLIENSNFNYNQKQLFLVWANEEFGGSKIAREIKDSNCVLIDSEGLIQRLFLYCYKKKNKPKIIKNYLNLINIPKALIYFKYFRSRKKYFYNFDNNELKNIFFLTLKELKKKKIILIDSNKSLEKIYDKLKSLR
tara:strand:+ start:16280 stop:16999 length:720 start_codon:yes stop_codon:yes gene_type:complete